MTRRTSSQLPRGTRTGDAGELLGRMSELISLRERLAQAELRARFSQVKFSPRLSGKAQREVAKHERSP
jgi:hypothetical protein